MNACARRLAAGIAAAAALAVATPAFAQEAAWPDWVWQGDSGVVVSGPVGTVPGWHMDDAWNDDHMDDDGTGWHVSGSGDAWHGDDDGHHDGYDDNGGHHDDHGHDDHHGDDHDGGWDD